ncbi:MAG: hypothetical protein KF705_15030, partial [Phycisphaeraceae bacterium]|nr:hypothetical protein [Phycisphaeraceae bacterium]
ESTKRRVIFSITLGVSFDHLNESQGSKLPPTRIPSSAHMHWHEHLETLPAKERRQAMMRLTNKDHEWRISNASDVEPVGAEIVTAMQKIAIPAIRRRRSIDAFLDEYDATGRNPIGADMNYALAELMLLRHRRKDAVRLLVEEVRTSVGHPSYENLIEGIETLGLDAGAIERAALKSRGRKQA